MPPVSEVGCETSMVPGEDLPWVTSHYDSLKNLPGARIAVVRWWGRSSDWAAIELHEAHEAGKQVYYVMRQGC